VTVSVPFCFVDLNRICIVLRPISPGVYFPEEVPSTSFRDNILKEIATDAIVSSSDWS